MAKKSEKARRSVDDLSSASLKEIVKAFSGKLDLLSEVGEGLEVETLPTGIESLDEATGVGGVPCGRILEIFGNESCGKTGLALHLIARAQRAGGKAAFIDAEHALDLDYARQLGVNEEELLFNQPDSGEAALDLWMSLLRSRAVNLIVTDSVDALVPLEVLEKDMTESVVAAQARMMSQALRKSAALVKESNAISVFINQTRAKIGVMWGSPVTTSGGGALRFYAGMRWQMTRTGSYKRGGEIRGLESKVQIVKNKVSKPFRTAHLRLVYGKGWESVSGDED